MLALKNIVRCLRCLGKKPPVVLELVRERVMDFVKELVVDWINTQVGESRVGESSIAPYLNIAF